MFTPEYACSATSRFPASRVLDLKIDLNAPLPPFAGYPLYINEIRAEIEDKKVFPPLPPLSLFR